MSSTEAPTRLQRQTGPLTERIMVEAPSVQRLDRAHLTEIASELAKKPVTPAPKALMELTARNPYDATHGNIDVFMPGRWDTTYNLIFMDTIVTGPEPGEWVGSAGYIMFKPPEDGSYLIVEHFTGWETTMHLYGPWGENTAYTAVTSDSGSVVALWSGSQEFEFTTNCTQPNNEYGIGYIESIQVFHLN